MKRENLELLRKKSGSEIVDDLENSRYSLLDSLGCRKLRLEMLVPGKTSSLIVSHLIKKAKRKRGNVLWVKSIRADIVELLKKLAPYKCVTKNDLPPNTDGLVIGFNHPSLGEVLRLISLVSEVYPHSKYLFPVNLPWYEALCPVLKDMREAGFVLTPIITPSTRNKIVKAAGAKMGEVADDISRSLNARYLELCRKFISEDEIIVVAPSAARQRTIFRSIDEYNRLEKVEPSTMSLLASLLTQDAEFSEAKFVPIAVGPPENFKRGLNLFETYEFGVAKPFLLSEAVELSREKYGKFKGREFDYAFLTRITFRLLDLGGHSDLIIP